MNQLKRGTWKRRNKEKSETKERNGNSKLKLMNDLENIRYEKKGKLV